MGKEPRRPNDRVPGRARRTARLRRHRPRPTRSVRARHGRHAGHLPAPGPLLVDAGYQVATVDIRGHGESTTGWGSYTQTSMGTDIVALIRHLGGPAVVLGHSFSSGSAVAAAAQAHADVTGIVLLSTARGAPKLNPFLAQVFKLVVRSPALWARYIRTL